MVKRFKCCVEYFSSGTAVKVFEFVPSNEDEIFSEWAAHFRKHYCNEIEIDDLRGSLSRAQYLISIKFPTQSGPLGPSTRAGDFGEILVADYLQYKLGYWVPRTRYDRKNIQNESTKGTDVIAFKLIGNVDSLEDILASFEVKTQFSKNKKRELGCLQRAINGSIKDNIRKAESLNAIRQRLYDRGESEEVKKIDRFQNPVDRPYKAIYGAAALFSNNFYDESLIANTTDVNHPNKENLSLIVIKNEDFMKLVHSLYERAANEA
jgi:hypothetical protein